MVILCKDLLINPHEGSANKTYGLWLVYLVSKTQGKVGLRKNGTTRPWGKQKDQGGSTWPTFVDWFVTPGLPPI